MSEDVDWPARGKSDASVLSGPEGVPGLRQADEGCVRRSSGRAAAVRSTNCDDDPLRDPIAREWADGPLRALEQ
jgi:hypothetical protein